MISALSREQSELRVARLLLAACAEVHTRLNTRCTRTCVLSNAASAREGAGAGAAREGAAASSATCTKFQISGRFLARVSQQLKEIVYACFWHVCVCAYVCVSVYSCVCVRYKLFSALALLMHDFKANTNFQFASAHRAHSGYPPIALLWLLATIVEYTISLIERPTLQPLPNTSTPNPLPL